VDHTYDNQRTHIVYYTLVDCNLLTPLLWSDSASRGRSSVARLLVKVVPACCRYICVLFYYKPNLKWIAKLNTCMDLYFASEDHVQPPFLLKFLQQAGFTYLEFTCYIHWGKCTEMFNDILQYNRHVVCSCRMQGGKNAENSRRKIFIGGLPSTVTENQLKEYFSRYGHVCSGFI